jgi:hypothetical protein
MPEIKVVCPTTRLPRDGDVGACAIGRYYVSDGVVVICDETGKPTGKSRRMGPGDDERTVASRLTLEAYRAASGGPGSFNRKLDYPRTGWS